MLRWMRVVWDLCSSSSNMGRIVHGFDIEMRYEAGWSLISYHLVDAESIDSVLFGIVNFWCFLSDEQESL